MTTTPTTTGTGAWTIDADRLAQLDTITIDHGSHNNFDDGHCSAAWAAEAAEAAGQPITPGSDTYWRIRDAAYKAARKHYQDHPPKVIQEIADLAATQDTLALELLEQLIDPQEDAVPAS